MVTAALLNTHLRDQLLWLKSDPLINEQRIAPGAANIAASSSTLTILSSGSLSIDSGIGAVYVEAWGGFSAGGYGAGHINWEFNISEATAGVIASYKIYDYSFARTQPGNGCFHIRTRDFAWGGTSRTLTLNLVTSNCTVSTWTTPISGDGGNYSEVVLRVVRRF